MVLACRMLHAGVSLAVLVLSASVVAPQPQQEIAFACMRDGNLEVYRMHGNGDAQTNLTRHAAEDTNPCWSPDGSKIAFVSWRDDNYEIYTMRPDGSEVSRQTNCPDADTEPAWSPDGRRLLFLRRIGGKNHLWALNVDHGHDTFLTQGDYDDMHPEWSPDGEWILLVRMTGEAAPQIWKIPSTGSGPAVQLTRDDQGASYGRWSPDGQWIVYASMRSGDPEIWKMRADGTGQTQLTRAVGLDRDPRWSPEGSAIAFVSSRDGNEEVYRMTPSGAGQTNLTRSPGYDGNPRWSEDSAHLLFESSRAGGGIFAMTADGKSVWALTQGTVSAKGRFGPRPAATPAPAGTAPVASSAWPEAIAYLRIRAGRPEEARGEIRLINPDGTNGRTLPGTGLGLGADISYDRGWIAYIRFLDPTASAAAELWRCRPDGTRQENITPAALGRRYYRFVRWFPDGARLLVAHMPAATADWGKGNMYGWLELPSLTWRPLQVVGLTVDLAPDGQRLAVVRNGEKPPGTYLLPSHIWITDLDGNNLRQLTADGYVDDTGPGWSPDGSKIAFLRRGRVQGTSTMLPTSDLCVVSASGGQPSIVVSGLLRPHSESRVVWSPDGSKLLVGSSHDGKHRLYAVTLADKRVTALTGGDESAEYHHWR